MTERIAPKIENAPGLRWMPRKRPVLGWVARWQARVDLKRRGYTIKERTILFVGDEPTDDERTFIAGMCQSLQDEMLVWARGGTPSAPTWDGTVRTLVYCYQTDRDSGYHALRYRTRLNYQSFLKRLLEEHGETPLAEIRARHVKRWNEDWSKVGAQTARGMIMIIRVLLGFGSSILEDSECQRLRGLLTAMRFKGVKARREILELHQVNAIRAKAHAMQFHSIALAQAFQFECTFRQRDVLGEWVPREEPGLSEIIDPGNQWKWLRGIRWSEIDADLKLVHTTSKTGKEIEIDLHNAPMVLEELALCYPNGRPAKGAVVINEKTGVPWRAESFRRVWRIIATSCGVPKKVYNMDSRAGAITEATDSGAALEDVRHAATHSNISMTQNYSRGSADKTAKVMEMRVAARNKT